jgi:hypothetical protein
MSKELNNVYEANEILFVLECVCIYLYVDAYTYVFFLNSIHCPRFLFIYINRKC